jgi:2-oxoglutarate ferredoxin oxidoreductase subunit gamma
MIVLGGLLGVKNILSFDSVMDALKKVLPERYHHLLPLNKQALLRGKELATAKVHA